MTRLVLRKKEEFCAEGHRPHEVKGQTGVRTARTDETHWWFIVSKVPESGKENEVLKRDLLNWTTVVNLVI